MSHYIRHGLTRFGVWTAHPAAFLVAATYGLLWCIFDWEKFSWHEFAVFATLLMTLTIQRAEHRDTQALHAKLDELLRSQSGARSEVARLDDKEPEEIESHRARVRADV